MKNIGEKKNKSVSREQTFSRDVPDKREIIHQMECLNPMPDEDSDLETIYGLSQAMKYAATGLFTCNAESPQHCVFSLCFGDTYFCVCPLFKKTGTIEI